MVSPLRLLLIDDDPVDGDLLKIAIQRGGHRIDIEQIFDPESAFSALKNREITHQLPDVVLLDINMPTMTGHAFLRAVRELGLAPQVPIVAYSTSSREEDIRAMYGLHCAGYIVKPADFAGLERVVMGLRVWWSDTVRLA